MATYKESGVDVELGDKCSKIAYEAAKATFKGREGKIGSAVIHEGGFAGLIDMGEFYLVQNDDGVGTKMEVAEQMGKFDTLGYDLIAMVADDAICMGAEVISVTNTLDTPKLDQVMVEGLMQGLKQAALEQNILVPGGELAELGNALNGSVWNATAVGVVEKDKVITGVDVAPEDVVIGLASQGIRSNGLSLARLILKQAFGEDWVSYDYGEGRTWGEVILTPCQIYHRSLLALLGGFKQSRKTQAIKALVHNTGGGIPGNLPRVLNGLGATLPDLLPPHEFMLKLMEMGNVSREEAYKTWNMGIGMMLVVEKSAADDVLVLLKAQNLKAQIMGQITSDSEVKF